ncbi:MAG TPA: hydrogenase maturation protease [Candidatus Acidoferrales bacterium]|nr:hydrogenase maturation protease [Candidatus Acidoferrales bacterium]
MIRIIGIGSPFGDDAAGLIAARRLAAAPPPGTEVIEADRPGATLIELLDGADAVILIDAAHTGAPPGTLHDLDLYDLPRNPIALVSSHDLGVVEALRLATVLGRAPARGRVLAIEVGSLEKAPQACSAVARAASEYAVRRARYWAEELRALTVESYAD